MYKHKFPTVVYMHETKPNQTKWLYDIKYSYLIDIIYKKIYLTERWEHDKYFYSMSERKRK